MEERETTELSPTSLHEEGLQEDDLREWILGNCEGILGEDLLIIGREVGVADIGDGIDILALDRAGNTVIIELKRGALTGTVDFQALKYVSYVSRWSYDDIKQQFEIFLQSDWGDEIHGADASFADTIESFCDDDYELNGKQRMLLVGESVRERIGSVVLWLRDQGIDARITQYSLFKNEDAELYLDSKTLVPTSSLEKFEAGETPDDKPWKIDGERWHLQERTNEDTAALVRQLVNALADVEGLAGPSWTQKVYIAFRIDGTNRALLRTRANSVIVDVRDFEIDDKDALLQRASGIVDTEEDVNLDVDRRDRNMLKMKCRPEDDIDFEELSSVIAELLIGVPKDESVADSQIQ
ncbi:hypothetical protein [Haloarchaeobius sp. DT45]|uniref:hypothetical protein n=1 Tax=Haloarchaeobius sp. DT45 TaxID=3446116 RepID=UPI003F6AA490